MNLNEDEFLREHLLLKGGTAINLTVFNLPRLSVDIDMDYTPNDTRENMLECRAKITDIIKEDMESEGYQLSEASRFSHSLDAFHYNYQNAGESCAGNQRRETVNQVKIRTFLIENVAVDHDPAEHGFSHRKITVGIIPVVHGVQKR